MEKSKLEKLEQKLRELVPESMELSFGCRILDKKWGSGVVLNACGSESNEIVVYLEKDTVVVLRREYCVESEDCKILGYDLTLEHCRVALRRGWRPPLTPANDINRQMDAIIENWQDLEPWESQHGVHSFLYPILVTEKS